MRLLLTSALLLQVGCWSAAIKTLDSSDTADDDRDFSSDDDGGSDDGGWDGGGSDDGGSDDGGGDDGGSDDGGGDGGGSDDGGSDDGGGDDGDAGDADGDGWTVDEGDCDDSDDRIYPDAEDDCDELDEDCDDIVDEDARYDDDYEPNDDLSDAVYLGNMDDTPEINLAGFLHNEGDVDRFFFYVDDDTFDFFTITIRLKNIPSSATYRMTFNRLDGSSEQELDSDYSSDEIVFQLEDVWGSEETGDYELVIEAESPPDCSRSYELSLLQDSW
jgi:hypothetical protein